MKNLSLQNKIFSIFFITITLSIGLVGWYGIKNASDAYLESAYKISQQSVSALTIEIEKKLEPVPKDTLYFTNFYALKRFLIWSSMNEETKAQEWKQIFSDALVDFLQTQEVYFKARIIGLDGQEIISAEYDKFTATTLVTPEEQLQNKSGREYVEKTKKLKRGEFYVSSMNLDIEHGKIQKPFIPVIRYATPIINSNDELVAIFVTSFYADNLINIIKKHHKHIEKNAIHYFLIDKKGNYLYNENPSKQWGAQLKNAENFNKEWFSTAKYFTNKNHGTFSKEGKIYSFEKVYPYSQSLDKYWYIISSIKESVALKKLDTFKLVFTLILITVLLISLYSVRIFVSRITIPLSKVTRQLKALSNGEIRKEDIIYNSKDEIGEIVHSTAKLVQAIETTVEQANAVADGDFTKETKLLSTHDTLGLAIKSMTERLKEITILAQNLAWGNYDVNIIVKNSSDKLGLALIDMVKYLKDITDITESIASGKVDTKYSIKSENDRLGKAVIEMTSYLENILKQANAISKKDFSRSLEAKSKNDELGLALVSMTDILRKSSIQNQNEIFFSEGTAKLSDALSGIEDSAKLAKKAITVMCRYINAACGTLYTYSEEKKKLQLLASFAFTSRENLSNSYELGEGIIGQVALEREPILLQNIKDNTYEIQSGTTLIKAKEVYAFALVHENILFGVVEIMSLESFSESHKDYLNKAASIFTTSLHTTSQNMQIKTLLEKSQQALEELQVQSEELQESNVQMEEQQQQLTIQSQDLKEKNENLAKAKEEINQRAQDLEKASAYKSEFLANMSHELRTPLNSIILLSKLLTQNQNKTLDEKDIEKTEVIHKAGNDLLLLINDILDLSKIESGNMELEIQELYTDELVKDIKGLFDVIADEKQLLFEIEDNFKSNFFTDKTKLSQILKNLLSNAFKFTKEGKVTLSITSQDKNIIFNVTDTGIGIANDKLEHIFDAFKQVDGSISREFGGTGLGLSISKNMVELLKGTIHVESRINECSSFIITLPLDDTQALRQPSSEIKSKQFMQEDEASYTSSIIVDEDEAFFDENTLLGKNILIVDDDSRNIFTLTSTLEAMNAEVYSAFNGQEAIELLETEKNIDLILMDIMMPVMDGLKAIENIKSNNTFKKIPIIAITAKSMPEDKQKCLDSGADDYLAKPLEHSALVAMIQAWIG